MAGSKSVSGNNNKLASGYKEAGRSMGNRQKSGQNQVGTMNTKKACGSPPKTIRKSLRIAKNAVKKDEHNKVKFDTYKAVREGISLAPLFSNRSKVPCQPEAKTSTTKYIHVYHPAPLPPPQREIEVQTEASVFPFSTSKIPPSLGLTLADLSLSIPSKPTHREKHGKPKNKLTNWRFYPIPRLGKSVTQNSLLGSAWTCPIQRPLQK